MNFGGFLFPVPLSVNNVQPGHLVRASLENLGFAIKANCLQLEEISGYNIEEIRIGGGLAQSRCLVRLLPSILGRPVSVLQMPEASALGAAVYAAIGSGFYSSPSEAVNAMFPGFSVSEPDPGIVLEYTDRYQRWLSTSRWLEKLSGEMK